MPAFPLVSQSVLLRGVNDDAATLEALMRTFVECRIKPYYLHHGDLAPGTAHLRTTLEQGQALMRGLRGRVSGLCQPEYVLDIPGGHGKAPVGPHYLSQDEFRRNVIYRRKRAIVSSIIAVRFTSIRRCRDLRDDGGRRGRAEAAGGEGNRTIENAVMLGFFVVLVAAGIWLLGTMADVRKAQDCAAQGRRNCATIDVPERCDRNEETGEPECGKPFCRWRWWF